MRNKYAILVIAVFFLLCISRSNPTDFSQDQESKSIGQEYIVEEDNAHWIWQPSETINEENADLVIEIRCLFGAEDHGLDEVCALLFQDDNKAAGFTKDMARFALSDKGIKAEEGHIVWNLFPQEKEDFIFLKKGSIELYRSVSMRSPFRITAEGLPKIETYYFRLPTYQPSKSSAMLVFYYFRIFIKPNSNLLGISLVTLNFLLNSDTNEISFVSETIKNLHGLLLGKILAPEYKWTPVKKNLEIMGGGLKFAPEGVSILSGTKVRQKQ